MIQKIAIKLFLLPAFVIMFSITGQGQELSHGRRTMDALLEAIRMDGLGPTIHARNLFHTSLAMYDAWAVYDKTASTYLLGKTVSEFSCAFNKDFKIPEADIDSMRNLAVAYAGYRVISHRFNQYGSKHRTMEAVDSVFISLGGVKGNNSVDYMSGSPEAMGNYIAECVINFGLQDGSREEDQHENYKYDPINPVMRPNLPGNTNLQHPNRWQPLSVRKYVDERGGDKSLADWVQILVLGRDVFLTPSWGDVVPFSLTEEDRKMVSRDDVPCQIYMDPGAPPHIGVEGDSLGDAAYKWNFLLNVLWSSHMDPADGVMIDISPQGIGSTGKLPDTFSEYKQFYNLMEGGSESKVHKVNPYTNKPYKKNIVPRGDYARVIAEYWVDAANTYTPPGHWVKNMQDVSDSPLFKRKWGGKGKVLDTLEWDVKAYLVLTGALHDAGVSAWGVKGYYDYVRPISAIRWMAENGQCSDEKLPRYHAEGLPLMKGKIELVTKNDPLVGKDKEHLNKVKLYCWRGPEYIQNPDTDMAGVGWILAENWWPYQRFSFATPPFAGYVSGHSTFSKAAAEVLTLVTGNPFFPGGLAEIKAPKNEFLEFEEGPSVDITLQWATYHDAADETCLSRIWGGIHPPVDDIPGRLMGLKVARKAYECANLYFNGKK
jgi:hypothetical protein